MEWMTIEEREHASTGNFQDYMKYVKNIDRGSLFFNNDHQYAMNQVTYEEREDLCSRDISDFTDWLSIEEGKEPSSRDQQNYKSVKTEEEECPQDYLNWLKNEDRVVLSVIDHQYAKGMPNTVEREDLTDSPLLCSKDWVNIDRWKDAPSKDHWDKLEDDEHLSLGNYEDYMYCLKIMKNHDNLPISDHQYAKTQVNSEENEVLSAWPISGPKEQITIGEFGEPMSIEPQNSMDWLNIEEGEDLFTRNSQDYTKGVKIEEGDHFPASKHQHVMDQRNGTERDGSSDRNISFCKSQIVGEEGGVAFPRDHWNSRVLVKIEAGNSEPIRKSKDYLNWGKIEAGEAPSTNNPHDSTDKVKREKIKCLSTRNFSYTNNSIKIEKGNSEPLRNISFCKGQIVGEVGGVPLPRDHWNSMVLVKIEAGHSEPIRNSKDYLNWGKLADGEAPSTNNHQDHIDKVKREKMKDFSARELSCKKDGLKIEASNSEPVRNSKDYLGLVKMEKGEASYTNNHHECINKAKMEDLSTREILCTENVVIVEAGNSEPVRNSKDYLNWGKIEDGEAPFTNNRQGSIDEVKREKMKDFPDGEFLCTRDGEKIEAGNSEPARSSKNYFSVKKEVREASSINCMENINQAKIEKCEYLSPRKVSCTKTVKMEALNTDTLVSNVWVKMEECEGSLSINCKNNGSMATIKVSDVSSGIYPCVIDQVNRVERKDLSAKDISCAKDQVEVEKGMESLLRNNQISSLWIKLEEVERASSSSCHDYTTWGNIKDGGELSLSNHKAEMEWRKTKEREDLSPREISCCLDRDKHEECKEADSTPLNSMEIVKFKVEKLLSRNHIDSVELVKCEDMERTSGVDEQGSVDCADSENGEEDPPDRYHLDSGGGETVLNFTAEDTAIANPDRKIKNQMYWNPPEVVALLDAVGTSRHLNSLVSSDRSRNTDAFTEISITLKKAGHSRTPAQCRNKMKTLRRLFHTKWSTANGKSGEVGTPFWVEHFTRVWALAGKPKYLFFKPPIMNSV